MEITFELSTWQVVFVVAEIALCLGVLWLLLGFLREPKDEVVEDGLEPTPGELN